MTIFYIVYHNRIVHINRLQTKNGLYIAKVYERKIIIVVVFPIFHFEIRVILHLRTVSMMVYVRLISNVI